MKDLLSFFSKNSPFFTWLFLAIISIALLFQSNPYQRSVWFGSASAVTGSVYDLQSNVTSYFGLREVNEDLLHRTGLLEAENLRLRQELQLYRDSMQMNIPNNELQYHFLIAHVVGNTITQVENYITLDKGTNDGVQPDLGVVDQNGVIGIVAKVSAHYSLVLSVLNPKLRISVMLRGSEAIGSLVWDGKDYRHASLEDLPRNVDYEIGDTIVTTGYTPSFPKDVPVGVIESSDDRGGSFMTLRIALFADFNRLQDVHVILNDHMQEIDELRDMSK